MYWVFSVYACTIMFTSKIHCSKVLIYSEWFIDNFLWFYSIDLSVGKTKIWYTYTNPDDLLDKKRFLKPRQEVARSLFYVGFSSHGTKTSKQSRFIIWFHLILKTLQLKWEFFPHLFTPVFVLLTNINLFVYFIIYTHIKDIGTKTLNIPLLFHISFILGHKNWKNKIVILFYVIYFI